MAVKTNLPNSRSRPFLLGFSIVFGIALALVVTINYWTDPANAFHARYSVAGRAAAILASGRNLALVRNLDDRIVQREFLKSTDRLPNIISLGSSRSREISSQAFPTGQRFFNHGVNGASVEDVVAIIGLYLKRDHLPDMMVWAIDPWLFNANHRDERWQSLAGSYRYAAEKMGLQSKHVSLLDKLSALKQQLELLLRWDPVVDFVQAVWSGQNQIWSAEQKVRVADGEDKARLIVFSDGSFQWGRKVLNRTAEEVGRFGRVAAENKLLGSIKDFDRLDARTKAVFEKIADFAQSHSVQLVLFLPPYQPDAYGVFKKRRSPSGLFETEAWLRKFSERRGLVLVGSYDPDRAGCSKGDFVDAHHPRRRCVNRILGRLAKESSR